MSAYGKSQPPLHAFDPSRTFSDSPYPFVGPTYGSQAPVSSSIAAPVFQTAQMTQMAFAPNPRMAYDDQSGPFLNVGSTPPPGITSYSPSRGSRGTKLSVQITSLYELQTTNTAMFFLSFGRQKCNATLARMGQQGAVCSYLVEAEAPQFSSTGWSAANVPISLLMETGDGDVIAKVDVGGFTYADGGSVGGEENSRKRKLSPGSADLMRIPAKRPSSHQLRPKEEFPSYGYASTDATGQYSPYIQQSANPYGNAPQYNRGAVLAASYQQPRHLSYGYSTSSTASPPTIKAQSPQSNWSPSYTVGPNMARTPVPSNARQSQAALPSPSLPNNPPLIRTSTLQQTPSPATTPHGGHQHFNAYALYPHKAKLEIQGDLDSMAAHWSTEEWENKRRLVHFRRSQSGSTITTNFHAVSPDDRQPNSVCISCIYWEEKGECFVTSVDTIYLLEQLVAARFTVEEKNRIRRNLEGFRPLTVSKGKADSEEFFKVIMAFPTPKPRNIEKDVKVFHWKDLASALKKIIGKYSASPSSTLPPASAHQALLTPVSSTGGAYDSGAGISYVSDHHGTLSPRSIAGSTTSTGYSTIPARVVSPLGQKSMTNLQSPSDLRVSVPNPHESPQQWQGTTHHMAASAQYQQQPQQALGSQSARTSWDMSSYLEPGSTSAGGTSTPQNGPPTSSIQNRINTNHGPSQNYSTNTRGAADSAGDNNNNRTARTLSQQSHQMPRT